MDRTTLLRLEEYNPWLSGALEWPEAADRYLPDEIIPRAAHLSLVPNRVTLIIGPRQAGKSTLVWLHARDLATPPLYLDLDDPLLRGLCASGAHFLGTMRQLGISPSALVFDEVQTLDEAGLFLKSLVDLKPGVPVVATGSSSYHLRARTRESLAGRATRMTLMPLSIGEAVLDAKATTPRHRWSLIPEEVTQKMARFGGFPAIWKASDDKQRELGLVDLVEALVLRDLSDIHDVRRPDAFRKVVRLAAGQTGSLVNLQEYASVAGISASTASGYLELLEESHVVKLLRPFLGGKRAEITRAPKIFFVDNGIRNYLHGGFQPLDARSDKGSVMESLVFSELIKTHGLMDELAFWRSRNGAEVDFVVERGGRLHAIEVKAASLGRPKVSRSLRSFVEAYRPHRAYVVNGSIREEIRVDGVSVRFLTVDELVEAIER